MEEQAKKNCGSCKYFVPEPGDLQIGICRRFPPQRGWNYFPVKTSKIGEVQMAQKPDCGFPFTGKTAWCGEFMPIGNDYAT